MKTNDIINRIISSYDNIRLAEYLDQWSYSDSGRHLTGVVANDDGSVDVSGVSADEIMDAIDCYICAGRDGGADDDMIIAEIDSMMQPGAVWGF